MAAKRVASEVRFVCPDSDLGVQDAGATSQQDALFLQIVDPDSGTLIRTKPRVERTRSLVTGGAGFVGSHLCDYLVQRGDHVRYTFAHMIILALICLLSHLGGVWLLATRARRRAREWAPCICVLAHVQVICIDNFFTGTRENVAHLLEKANFELIRHDVVNPILLEVDEIYHMACPASPVHYKCVCSRVHQRACHLCGHHET